MSAGCLTLLIVAAGLAPSQAGKGTHTQLGLPPCAWDAVLDFPCATCGMTTSFAHASHGDLASAAMTQPLGALLAISVAALFWVGLHSALTGSHAVRLALRAVTPRSLAWFGIAAIAAWGYKVWAQGQGL